MPDYVLALDEGTTSARAILFDREGNVVTTAQQEFEQIYPQPGWVEHDAEAIWAAQLGVAQQVLTDRQVTAGEIAAIGITNQRETAIIWDRATGQPIYNAIVWQDRRTAAFCDELRAEGFEATLTAKTGLLADPYFSGTKVKWLLDHVPGARARAEAGELAFGTIDTFLIWRLTGGRLHVTDVSNASRTLLYDIHKGDWSSTILARFDIPRALLPQVRPSCEVYGECDGALFGQPIPISGIAGDQQAATYGQACFSPGLAKNTYGTGCFLLMNTGTQATASTHKLLTTIAWQIGDAPVQYALEGSIFVAGAAVQWLRDELQIIRDAGETDALAASVPDTGGVYLVPAFVGLGAPYWDAYARGTIVGLTRGSNRAHITRATLESVAYQSRDVVDAMRADAGLTLKALRVDGGMVRNDFLMQFQADILGVPVERPAVAEITALGAAYLAGQAVGFYPAQEQLAREWRAARVYEPRMSADERDGLYARWRLAVERARGWAE